MVNEAISKAIEIVGGQGALASLCGVRQQAVYGWTQRGCPAERVLQVEKATDGQVTRHQLRPDLYPDEEGAAA